MFSACCQVLDAKWSPKGYGVPIHLNPVSWHPQDEVSLGSEEIRWSRPTYGDGFQQENRNEEGNTAYAQAERQARSEGEGRWPCEADPSQGAREERRRRA